MFVTEGRPSILVRRSVLISEAQTMKTFFWGLLVFAILFHASAIANDNSMNDLKIKIVKVLPSGGIVLEILNSSNKPIRIWKESNSWGAARWRVLLTRKGQLATFFQNPDQ